MTDTVYETQLLENTASNVNHKFLPGQGYIPVKREYDIFISLRKGRIHEDV